jgi:hypothetical protein
MSIHIVSDPKLQRPGYVYKDGVGVRQDRVPSVNYKHIDGPLLYTSDAGLHWLTYWERIQLFFGWKSLSEIDRKHRR